MTSQLQRIVDDIGSRLQRAAAIDDTSLRIQVYSPHFGPVDETRLASILQRRAPGEARSWVESLGIASSNTAMRVPANNDLGFLPRICAPIRFQDVHLGYLWLIDADETLTDADLEQAQEAADRAAVLMYRGQLLEQLERGRERELLRDVLSGDAALAGHAATQLVEEDLFVRGAKPAALAVRLLVDPDTTIADRERVTMDAVLESARGRLSARHAVQLVRPDHGVLVFASNDRALRQDGPAGFAQGIHRMLSTRLPDVLRIVIGIGDPQPTLQDTGASYRQAMRATEVVRIVPSFGDVGTWSTFGIYRTLSQLPPAELRSDALHPGLLRLLEDESHWGLVATLEAYLDNAGDAKVTADALGIHRTSLYYRLNRIAELADVDFKKGEDRLALHLGLKMARLGGLWDDERARRSLTSK